MSILLHLDIKRLARVAWPSHCVTGNRRDKVLGIGTECVHIAIDDHSRSAFSAIYPDKTRASVLHFLQTALAYYEQLGIGFKAVLTATASATAPTPLPMPVEPSASSTAAPGPYTPRTNGKAERFIQIALREWAYARTYQNSGEREQPLAPWIQRYNWHRPNSSLCLSSLITRAGRRNKLLRLHT